MPGVCLEICDKHGNNCVGNCYEVGNARNSNTNNKESHSPGTITRSNPSWTPPGMPSRSQQQQIASIANNPANIPITNATQAIEQLEAAQAQAKEQLSHEHFSLTNFQVAVLIALGAFLVPTSVVAATGTALTAISIGTVALPEIAAVELGANAAFMAAATRAGAIIGAGKYLNIFGVFKQTTQKAVAVGEKHALEGWTEERVITYVEELGLETERDTALLWSGLGPGNAGITISKDFAIKNGYTTLEMTKGGEWLNEIGLGLPNSPFSIAQQKAIWRAVSKSFVEKASGQINSIVGRIDPDSVYMSLERSILRDRYPQITGIDELQLLPRMIFK